ncbi:putative EF-hand domain, calcium/proton exchanger, sodium/calcium exchanger membrane region [Helianthus debilis subsp. tardiflorus]
MVAVSGLSGSKETAQDQVFVGMGLLAGSTVMLLTSIWGTCIVVGKCDLQNSVAQDNKDTKGFNLRGSGVSTDIWTSYSAMIMAVSVLPFIVVQLPQILHSTSGRHAAVLVALVLSVSLLIAYCLYQVTFWLSSVYTIHVLVRMTILKHSATVLQVYQPTLQKRHLDFAKHKHVRSRILKYLKKRALGRLIDSNGEPNQEVLLKLVLNPIRPVLLTFLWGLIYGCCDRLFNSIDVNQDGSLSVPELRALVVGMQLYEINLNEDDAVTKVMKDFDTSENNEVEFDEFVTGIGRWLDEAKGFKKTTSLAGPDSLKYVHDYYEETKKEHDLLGDQTHDDEEEEEGVDDPRTTTIKAVLLLLLGTVIAAVFADPLVDAVDNFSAATHIPSFFISFMVLPLATNSSEAVSAIIFATRKRQRSASLTFSELYGAVTMNNVLCLSVFLALVYARGLTWDFSSEVLVILIVCIVMGVFGSCRTTFPLWTSFVAFLLYPFSLILVYVLDYGYGWS